MSAPRGLVAALVMATPQLGLAALVLAAVAVGSEYRYATWGHLLVRQPRRLVLLAGKLAGTAVVCGLLLAAAVLSTVAVAGRTAAARGVPTSGWWSAEGTQALGAASGRAAVVMLCCVALGAGLGLLTRSSTVALGIGVTWFLLLEPAASALLGQEHPDVAAWLPRALLDAVAWGAGSSLPSMGLLEAGLRVALVSAGLLAAGCWALRRRDLCR